MVKETGHSSVIRGRIVGGIVVGVAFLFLLLFVVVIGIFLVVSLIIVGASCIYRFLHSA